MSHQTKPTTVTVYQDEQFNDPQIHALEYFGDMPATDDKDVLAQHLSADQNKVNAAVDKAPGKPCHIVTFDHSIYELMDACKNTPGIVMCCEWWQVGYGGYVYRLNAEITHKELSLFTAIHNGCPTPTELYGDVETMKKTIEDKGLTVY